MKIALIGYGKMGQMIEEVAIARGHQVVLKIHIDNTQEFTSQNLSKADIAIEFTGPDSAYDNVKRCLSLGIPVVSGSTGWHHRLDEMKRFCESSHGTFLHASNFSIGVNIFFEINELLARLMTSHPEYTVSIKEIHHTQKKDAPSGTAVTLAEQILALQSQKNSWINHASDNPATIPIISERIDPAAGTHEIKYTSDVDDIEIIHTAHNRKGFALGAVLAAEYIKDKKGIFSMQDVLKNNGPGKSK